MNIYEKLLAIQTELKAPKSQYNSFGKYNYRNCEDILEAVKPLLANHKAALQVTDEIVLIGDRYYVKATALFIDVETGENFENVSYAREEDKKTGMDAAQLTGATSSYARKYALNGLFAIDDTKDSDATGTGKGKKDGDGKKEKTPREKLIAELKKQGKDINAYAAEKGLTTKTKPERYTELLEELQGAKK